VQVGVEEIIAYRKLITQSCGQKLKDIYIHEFGIWAPPGFTMGQAIAWVFDRITDLKEKYHEPVTATT